MAESSSQRIKRISRIQGHREATDEWWFKKFQDLLGQLKCVSQVLLPKKDSIMRQLKKPTQAMLAQVCTHSTHSFCLLCHHFSLSALLSLSCNQQIFVKHFQCNCCWQCSRKQNRWDAYSSWNVYFWDYYTNFQKDSLRLLNPSYFIVFSFPCLTFRIPFSEVKN